MPSPIAACYGTVCNTLSVLIRALLPAMGMSCWRSACFLQVMHGALLGSAEVILALHAAGSFPAAALLRRAVAVAPNLDEARAFRGRGAELLRAGACRCGRRTYVFQSL